MEYVENLDKMKCIFCDKDLSLKYYKRHLRTRRHKKVQKELIDSSLLFLPKDINNIIFSYFYDRKTELRKYYERKDYVKEEKLRRTLEEQRLLVIYNKWYNKCIRSVKYFTYKLFNPYD